MKKTLLSLLLALICTFALAADKVPAHPHIEVVTTIGTFKLELDGKAAPITVRNFLNLVDSGFYDGTIFHRVIPGFMIQGGDPNSKSQDRSGHGMGGPGYSIPAEFNNTRHDRGIVSMARSQNPNSAGWQFFICVKDSHFLDGQYTAFGRVIKGMDVADKIVKESRDRGDNPHKRVEMNVYIMKGASK